MTNYFKYHPNYFWEFTADDAIAIPNSYTICYRGFLNQILEILSMNGIPKLGSLLATIAVTNKNTGQESYEKIKEIAENICSSNHYHIVSDALSFLNELAQISDVYKTDFNRKILLQKIFFNSHKRYSISNSKKILALLNHSEMYKEDLLSVVNKNEEGLSKILFDDFRGLALLKRKITSIDDLLNEIIAPSEEIDLNKQITQDKNENLLDKLEAISHTKVSATIAKKLISILNIPHHHTLPSQQPLGGVSDISNKGSYDQILISEFAYDDLTFMSRLANNESLFLRREMPPFKNKVQRNILIDTSISSWGTIRRVAYGIMLAIANHPKSDFECICYNLNQHSSRVNIKSKAGILEGLSNLDISLTCSEGLNKWLKSDEFKKDSENIFISEKDTLYSLSFAPSFQYIHEHFHYIFTIDENGLIELFKCTKKSLRLLQKIQLQKNELEPLSNLKKQAIESKPGAIPILLSNSSNPKRVFSLNEDTIYILNQDYSLLKLYHHPSLNINKYELIPENLGSYDRLTLGQNKEGDHLFLAIKNEKEIAIINVQKNTKIVHEISEELEDFFNKPFFYYQFAFWNENSVKVDEKFFGISAINQLEIVRKIEQIKDKKRYFSAPSVIKRLENVSINVSLKIQINNHELQLNSYDQITLSAVKYDNVLEEAIKIKENIFVFKNSLHIELDKAGFIAIYNPTISVTKIYIPAIIDQRICIANEEAFAGDVTFQKCSMYELRFTKPIENKIEVIKELNKVWQIGLAESKKIVDNAPCVITSGVDYLNAQKIVQHLLKVEPLCVELYPIFENQQEVIDSSLFFDRYLNNLINIF